MAYKNLANYVKLIPYVGIRMEELVDSLDFAMWDTDWFMPYNQFFDNYQDSRRVKSYTNEDWLFHMGSYHPQSHKFTIHNYKGRGAGSFLYNLAIRGPLVLLGNVIAAPFNVIATFFDVVRGYETYPGGEKYCDWSNSPGLSLLNMFTTGIIQNIVANFTNCLFQGVVGGGLITPLRALSKITATAGSLLDDAVGNVFSSTYKRFSESGLGLTSTHHPDKKMDSSEATPPVNNPDSLLVNKNSIDAKNVPASNVEEDLENNHSPTRNSF